MDAAGGVVSTSTEPEVVIALVLPKLSVSVSNQR
jgi:hypothetical protein